MRYFINSILLASLAKFWSWAGIFFIGLIIGICLGGFWLLENPNTDIISFSLGTMKYGTFWGFAGIAAAKLSRILLFALICLLIPSNKYSITAGKIILLLLSVVLGIICTLFIKSAGHDCFGIFYLIVPVFCILWTLSIGTLKTNFREKGKMAVMPVLLAMVAGLYQAFL